MPKSGLESVLLLASVIGKIAEGQASILRKASSIGWMPVVIECLDGVEKAETLSLSVTLVWREARQKFRVRVDFRLRYGVTPTSFEIVEHFGITTEDIPLHHPRTPGQAGGEDVPLIEDVNETREVEISTVYDTRLGTSNMMRKLSSRRSALSRQKAGSWSLMELAQVAMSQYCPVGTNSTNC